MAAPRGGRQLHRRSDPDSGRSTQQDPIGIAGGANVYGFANGDPINFSDPFGLCVKEDLNCRYLVKMLRGQSGAVFQQAADAYDALKAGRVWFIAESQWGPLRRSQGTRGLAPIGKDGDVWLQGESSRGDFLATAVHEAWHLKGHDHDQALVQAVYDAWSGLSERERKAAVETGVWLYEMTNGQVGTPRSPAASDSSAKKP